jgi:hypothetical protein
MHDNSLPNTSTVLSGAGQGCLGAELALSDGFEAKTQFAVLFGDGFVI